MNIRRTTYTVRGEHVSLPFIATLADIRPEAAEPPPAGPPAAVPKFGGRRGARRGVTKAERERDREGYERVMRRIMSGGV
jgi:hypothetical protein